MRPIDDHARTDHPYLAAVDRCWCLAEYVSGAGRRVGSVNRLINTLKYAPSAVAYDPLRLWHKRCAVHAVAALVRRHVSREWAQSVTWIPIPPSRAACDRDYDNRLVQVLRTAFADYDVDIRTALYQATNTTPDHVRPRRASFDELFGALRLNWAAIESRPLRNGLVLFDDVLTTGKHFRCCERRLHRALPRIRIDGLFVARRALSGRGRRSP